MYQHGDGTSQTIVLKERQHEHSHFARGRIAMAKTNFSITREQVLQHVSYNPETGEMRYVTSGHKRAAGDLIPPSRNVVNVLGSSYSKRKLIWFIQTGEWPQHRVNGVEFGNRDAAWQDMRKGRVDRSRELTAERLREALDYNRETGDFTWKIRTSSTNLVGTPAGVRTSDDGYWVIRLDGRLHLAHRLAHLHVTGEWPDVWIDHEDHDGGNNAWSNLRPATKIQNGQNRSGAQSNNKASGLLGVYWNEQNGKWGAKANMAGKQHFGGYYDTPEQAHVAAMELRKRIGSFWSPNSPTSSPKKTVG